MVNKSITKLVSSALVKEQTGSDRQRRQVNQTRLKLLKAARTVFAEKGLDLATIDEITARADVGKGTFYYHFQNKEILVSQLIDDLLKELAEAIRGKVNSTDKLEQVIESVIRAHIEFFKGRWEDYIIYLQSRADLALEENKSIIESPFVEYLGCIESVLDKAIHRRLKPVNLRRIACAIAGFVSGFYSFALIEMKNSRLDKSVDVIMEVLVSGIAQFINEPGS